jgi:DNA-binding transcriptional ArsR family regulator
MITNTETHGNVKRSITGLGYFRTLRLQELHRTTKAVLREIAFRVWHEGRDMGFACRGVDRLAAALDMSSATVKRHLALLERAGLIRRERRGCVKGGRLRDRIELVGFASWVRRNRPVAARIYTFCSSVLNAVKQAANRGGVWDHFEPFDIKDSLLTTSHTYQGAPPDARRGFEFGLGVRT